MTIAEKLDAMCPLFERMDKLFGARQNVAPAFAGENPIEAATPDLASEGESPNVLVHDGSVSSSNEENGLDFSWLVDINPNDSTPVQGCLNLSFKKFERSLMPLDMDSFLVSQVSSEMEQSITNNENDDKAKVKQVSSEIEPNITKNDDLKSDDREKVKQVSGIRVHK
jgi:hypothetical protein